MAKKPVVFFNARVVELADTLGLRPNAFLSVRVRVPSRAYLCIYIIIINSTTKKETNMITLLILVIGIPLVALLTDESIFLYIGLAISIICTILFIGGGLITKQVSKPTEIPTPAKYTNQTYYIDNSKRLYIQQNDTTKPFGGRYFI